MHEGEEGHARPGWTTSRRGQDSPSLRGRVNQNDGGRINGESTFMVWPTLGSRLAKEQEQEQEAAYKGMWAVKLCSSKVLQFLTGGAGSCRSTFMMAIKRL